MTKKIYVRNSTSQSLRLQNGFNLVELMVAIALGVFLILGVTNILFSGQQSFNATNRIARIQENGQLAKNMLVSDLKRARFMGVNINLQNLTGTAITANPAVVDSTATCNDTNNSWALMIRQGLFGLDDGQIANGATYQCITNINNGTQGSYIRGDILTVRYASPWQPTFNNGTFYIRSTFTASWIFDGQNQANPNNSETIIPGTGAVQDPINSAHELISYSYYVGDSGRQCAGQAIPSLFRISLNGGVPTPQEIFPGIENFQVRFSMDGTNYVDANANMDLDNDGDGLPDWNNVVATQIWLLARSECPEGGHNDNGPYSSPDPNPDVNNFIPGDSYRREDYTSIISHRN